MVLARSRCARTDVLGTWLWRAEWRVIVSSLVCVLGAFHPMAMLRTSGWAVYGASLVLGVLAGAELVFMLLSKAQPLMRLMELIQLYLERLHPALGLVMGR